MIATECDFVRDDPDQHRHRLTGGQLTGWETVVFVLDDEVPADAYEFAAAAD